MANLVLFCDGTWNTQDQRVNGLVCPTNVVKLYNACADSIDQLRYYHPGVGTEGSRIGKVLGGALGLGLDQNIQSGYHWLCRHYSPGDRIFLFGFSRGAYTARSLSGFILACGLLDLSDLAPAKAWKRIDTAYLRGYRGEESPAIWAQDWPCLKNREGFPPEIHFIGVWDTVGARGIPDDLVLLDLIADRSRRYRFHNTNLSDHVIHARHAVALDEMRSSFSPTLWSAYAGRPPGHTFKQQWFAGDHCDVGGGHPEAGLSDCALLWMLDEAQAQGLELVQGFVDQVRPDPRGPLHHSVDGVFARMRTLPRAVPEMDISNTSSLDGQLHESAWSRHVSPPISQAPYRPSRRVAPGESLALTVFARDHWNAAGVYLEAGVSYHLRAEGEWKDLNNRSGPGGMKDGDFQIGELAYSIGDAMGLFEERYKAVAGKEHSDFWSSRRWEKAPWFALVGMIANQDDVGAEGQPPMGETFLIGAGTRFRPKRSGYLYAFANDAWGFYGNNRGSVTLTVSRN